MQMRGAAARLHRALRAVVLACCCASVAPFHAAPGAPSGSGMRCARGVAAAHSIFAAATTTAVAAPSSAWQLDSYSRPVQGADGKKLWELLVTDETGAFRHVEAVPSNCATKAAPQSARAKPVSHCAVHAREKIALRAPSLIPSKTKPTGMLAWTHQTGMP